MTENVQPDYPRILLKRMPPPTQSDIMRAVLRVCADYEAQPGSVPQTRMERAITLIRSAAKNGNRTAVLALASFHIKGVIIRENHVQAAKLLAAPALAGDEEAERMLTQLLETVVTNRDRTHQRHVFLAAGRPQEAPPTAKANHRHRQALAIG